MCTIKYWTYMWMDSHTSSFSIHRSEKNLMKINGMWRAERDHPEIVRPVIHAQVLIDDRICPIDPSQRENHLLGRDILNYFALVADREANLVTLLRPPHRYSIYRK